MTCAASPFFWALYVALPLDKEILFLPSVSDPHLANFSVSFLISSAIEYYYYSFNSSALQAQFFTVLYFLVHRLFYTVYATWSNCHIFSEQWSSHHCAVSSVMYSTRASSLSTVHWLNHFIFYRIAFHSTCFMHSTVLSLTHLFCSLRVLVTCTCICLSPAPRMINLL